MAYRYPGPYLAEIVKITDSDTLRVNVRAWPTLTVYTAVRVRGIDTPEKYRPKCLKERTLARLAGNYVKGLLKPGDLVQLTDITFGKYAGRVVARVGIAAPGGGWSDLGEALLAGGYARPYYGGRKQGWCG